MAFRNMPKYIFKKILLPFVMLLKIMEMKMHLSTASIWRRPPGSERDVRIVSLVPFCSKCREIPPFLA